ncbi:DUF362 domain-containing protein [Butyrivibrio sp. FCS014]|uniref:DUF362 domain-containing protein n=1 Tax=Butyrivibrio sp. FCS014 TaxID=1408304 RepID=UPI000466EE5D|nr:DUF362 domain-containing protein [Butyrivibrio sp. FCS014]
MSGFDPVALVKCDTYREDDIRKALDESLSLCDGLSFVKPGMKVAIKVNLVSAMDPEKAATTHPALLKRLCELLTERGAQVTLGDSPGGLFTPAFVGNVYRACGLNDLVRDGVSLNQNFSVKNGEFPEAVSLKSFSYTGWLDDADVIINFSKLKTHAMMGMSCAVKNMFGTVPGTTKPEYHMRFPEEKAFANVMVDLNEYFKPVLYVVDAIDGMEGNGPTAGEKRHIGCILASKRPYALDLVCGHLIGMGIKDVQTLLVAKERGLGPENISEVEILGDLKPEDAKIPDFKRATIHQSITFEGGGVFNTIKSWGVKIAFNTKPLVKRDECIGCKKCFETCPAKAITMVPAPNKTGKNGQIPQIDRSKCIKCFCCQEFCPVGAMKVHYNPIGKLVNLVSGN